MICWKALQSDPNPLHQVLFTATQLAQNSGAAEIGIDHLLAALHCPSRPEEELVSLFEQVPENGGGFFYNTEWMRLSKGVVAAITRSGDSKASQMSKWFATLWLRPENAGSVDLAVQVSSLNRVDASP
jgi:hypothetical protein